MNSITVIGLDLAGVSSRPSGFAVLNRKKISTSLVHSDREIISICINENPTTIAMDAPLSKPRKGGLRNCDRELIHRGLRVFPPLFGGMKKLTERGIKISKTLRSRGLKVIEIHPRTSGMLLFGTPDRGLWVKKLKTLGYDLKTTETPHEIDAAIAALTGFLYLLGKSNEVGNPEKIIVPLPRSLDNISCSKRGSINLHSSAQPTRA